MVLDRVPRRRFARGADYGYGARPWLKYCSLVEGALLSVRLRSPPNCQSASPAQITTRAGGQRESLSALRRPHDTLVSATILNRVGTSVSRIFGEHVEALGFMARLNA